MFSLLIYEIFRKSPCKSNIYASLFNAPLLAKNSYTVHLILMELVVLICLLGVPSMASWVVSSAGASDINRSIRQTAEKAASLALK